MAGLSDYYLTQTIRPTHVDFRSDTQLSSFVDITKLSFLLGLCQITTLYFSVLRQFFNKE
jgi:hypothetical protein